MITRFPVTSTRSSRIRPPVRSTIRCLIVSSHSAEGSLPFGPCLTVEAAGFGHWLLLESTTLFPSSTLSSKTLHASSSLDVKWLHVPQLHSSQSGHHIVCCDSVSSGGNSRILLHRIIDSPAVETTRSRSQLHR